MNLVFSMNKIPYDESIYVVIFAGGSGTRLWPMSRQQMPKQFHILTGKRSLLQDTFDRVVMALSAERIFVLTTDLFAQETKRQLPELPAENIIIEPIGRNTAAATALAAQVVHRIDPNAIVATLHSDHIITYPERFVPALRDAFTVVKHDPKTIVTIGIQPLHADTGLGYIQKGAERTDIPHTSHKIHRAERFVEKPDSITANQYLKSGDYLWNAGYFIWHVRTMMEAIEKYDPELAAKINRYTQAKRKYEQRAIYETIRPQPVDTVIMEPYDSMHVIPADLGWSDVGNWASLHEILKIENGKDSVIKGDHIGVDTENVLILGHNKLIATAGLKDVIVVDTPDVMLICHKDKAQDIKKLLEQLTEQGKQNYL